MAQSVLSYLGSDKVESALITLHEANLGLTKTEAEGRMIMQCCRILDYGRHFHKVVEIQGSEIFQVVLGISTVGVDCWRLDDNDELFRELAYTVEWSHIKSVSLSKTSLLIETYSVDYPVLEFATDSIKKGKYLLQLCSTHYKFNDAIGQSLMNKEEKPKQSFSKMEEKLPRNSSNPNYAKVYFYFSQKKKTLQNETNQIM